MSNMIQWVDKGNQSAAFQLVEAGYEVWLGNFRGDLYSQKHVKLSRFDNPTEYFNYSFHEMGIYDLPAQLELIRNISGSSSKIHFIGYSWGGTIASVYASMLPEHAREHIHLFIFYGPVVFLNLEKNILKSATRFRDLAFKIANFYNASNIIAYVRVAYYGYYLCFEFPRISETCGKLINLIFGENPEGQNPSLLPSLINHNGYSLSVKSGVHFAQIYSSGRFQMFDYGESDNHIYYNSPIPPEYPLENILIPTHIFYGKTDITGTEKDALKLYSMLRPELRYGITDVGYNHMNLMYGKNIYENLVLPTIKIIEDFPT